MNISMLVDPHKVETSLGRDEEKYQHVMHNSVRNYVPYNKVICDFMNILRFFWMVT
jgi:hypothetical protein